MQAGEHTGAMTPQQLRAAQIAALAAHPGMPQALRALCEGILELFKGNRLLNIIVSDRARVAMGLLAVYLDADYDPRNPLSGLTVNRYKAKCAATGLCSPNRAVAMVGLMRFAGHLEPASRSERGQRLRLAPTEKLLGPMRERWRRVFGGLRYVRPEGAVGLALVDDPAFAKAFVRAIADRMFARERLVAHGPGIELFVDRKAGLVTLMSLMLSAAPGDDMPPRGPLSITAAELARRTAVSRPQIVDLLQSAIAAGLLAPAEPARSDYVITPRLRDSILGFFAALFVLVADGITAAEFALREGAPPMESVA